MNKWDLGGSLRACERRRVSEFPGCRLAHFDHGADVNNEYFLERIATASVTEKWWNVLVEGRSSFAQSDTLRVFRESCQRPR
jgi:hypothetical protein